jgi:hypothetical protein
VLVAVALILQEHQQTQLLVLVDLVLPQLSQDHQ